MKNTNFPGDRRVLFTTFHTPFHAHDGFLLTEMQASAQVNEDSPICGNVTKKNSVGFFLSGFVSDGTIVV